MYLLKFSKTYNASPIFFNIIFQNIAYNLILKKIKSMENDHITNVENNDVANNFDYE